MRLIKNILSKFGYSIVPEELDVNFDPVVNEFNELWQQVRPLTLTTKERGYALYKAVRYIISSDIRGDFVECGVWRGGSALLMALTLKELKADRAIWLYDSYSGMPEPCIYDTPIIYNRGNLDWLKVSPDEVRNTLKGYNVRLIEGMVEKTIPAEMPDKIALLRLDTDYYSSTRHELEHLYPLLVKSGVLLIDDYGWWSGARKAVDEYFGENILLNRIDISGRIAVK